MPGLLADFLFGQNLGTPLGIFQGKFVQLTSNVFGTVIVSAAPSNAQGQFQIANVPAGSYSLAIGPSAAGPWTTVDPGYVVGDLAYVFNLRDYGALGADLDLVPALMPIVIGPSAPTPQGLPGPGARGEAGGGGGSSSRYRRWGIGGFPRSYGPAPARGITRYQAGVGLGLVASVALFVFGQRLLGGVALAGTIAIMAAPKQ